MPRPPSNIADLPRPPFNIADHYWIVGGSTIDVYSSRERRFVRVSDTMYQTWLATGRLPTSILSSDELWQVLSEQYQDGLPADGSGDMVYAAYRVSKIDTAVLDVTHAVDTRLRTREGQPARTRAEFEEYCRSRILRT